MACAQYSLFPSEWYLNANEKLEANCEKDISNKVEVVRFWCQCSASFLSVSFFKLFWDF